MSEISTVERPEWSSIVEWEQAMVREQLRRGDRVVLVSKYDGTRVPAVVTARPEGLLLQAALAGAPIGTPVQLTHWLVELPPDSLAVCDA